MKAKLFAIGLLLATAVTPANANDAYIKVDANGNAIGGAIVCSADVCGDANSVYSKLTLQPGERYVLQFKGDPVTGNVAGIPATDPNVTLKVNTQTNEWTKTTTQVLPEPTPVTINGNTVTVSEVKVVEKWNPTVTEPRPEPQPTITPKPTETSTVTTPISDTPTVTTGSTIDSSTVTTLTTTPEVVETEESSEEEPVVDWLQLLYINWQALMDWFAAFFAEMSNQ